jgi:hypothetical protein
MHVGVRALAAMTLVLCLSCTGGTGGRCSTSAECNAGLVCTRTAQSADGASVAHACMRRCGIDAAAQRLCSDGTVCLAIDGTEVCYPGGGVALGSPCTNDLQCEGGTACAPDGTCQQVCTAGAPPGCDGGTCPCRPTETCSAAGFCVASP